MNVSLKTNPVPAQWVEITDTGVLLKSGKVEIGQGLGIALVQIAADELDLPVEAVELVAGDTARTPDEMWTSASISIEVGGAAVRTVCAALRERARQSAARVLNVAPETVRLRLGIFTATEAERRLGYFDLREDVDLSAPLTDKELATSRMATHVAVGTPVPRRDLRAKLTGSGFIHDIDRPGMLHGRVLLPTRPGARLADIDLDALRSLPGVTHVIRDGDFLGLCALREEQAIAALTKAEALAAWSGGTVSPPSDINALLDRFEASPQPVSGEATEGGAVFLTATRPFVAHASIGLCCAIAEPKRQGVTVWSHSQGVFPLRRTLATALDLREDQVRVIHADGAGCYGHNGADDVALDAALLARAVGAPVRVLWTRAQELSAAPAGPAMSASISASLGPDGRIASWHHRIKGFTHLTRPGWGEGVNLASAWRLAIPKAQAPTADPAQVPFGGAGCRNAPLLYDVPSSVDYALISARPLRTSALRALGAHLNVFAIEAMMDDLAEAAGQDPLAFRLAHLADARARAVLEVVAQMSGWPPDPSDGSSGRGLGFARYKNAAAYCAVVADLSLEKDVRVTRIWCAVDAGLAINPDGLRNQLEGGILQAISFTLKEAMPWTQEGFAASGWDDYPILRFDEVPEIEIDLIGDPSDPPLGVGECTTGPTAAAIGNAIKQALGVRVADMPLTVDRIAAALV